MYAVFKSLREQQLNCKPSKGLFGATETLYLGHVTTGPTIAPDPQKLEAVKELPVPKCVSDVRSLIEFANFFRSFVPHYADIARHLDQVTGRNAHFSWNSERQRSFELLKEA